ncbi:MAG: hypothetical protein QOK48_1574 [Blastocatellia bacterium]|jgi:hypothetical protein|nr:hypothetical protein [Blastocatellia bacterium]
MLRIVLGVISGFIAWLIVWVGTEKILSAVWPAFGVHQRAFEQAVKNGPNASGFTADTTMLLTHIVVGSIVAVMAGSLAALIARENTRAPLALGFLLLALGLLKAVMSWPYVPVWYHVIFTVILLPMAIMGGKLITTT